MASLNSIAPPFPGLVQKLLALLRADDNLVPALVHVLAVGTSGSADGKICELHVMSAQQRHPERTRRVTSSRFTETV